jgi:hypothetical protein
MTGMLVDLAAFSDDFCGGQAHAGMAKMARATWKKASEEINLLDSVPKDYSLVVTAHSLGAGAGVACLITILLYYEKKHNPNFMGLPNKIRCMAYASPPVFYPLLVAADAVQNTVAYVHNMDCVSLLSVDGVRRFVRTSNDLDVPLVKMPHKKTYPGFTPPQELIEAVNKSAMEPLALKDRAPLLLAFQHTVSFGYKRRRKNNTPPRCWILFCIVKRWLTYTVAAITCNPSMSWPFICFAKQKKITS